MKTINDIELCTGCRVCEYVCPQGAITWVADDEGFMNPMILKNKCIHCGLCYKKCPQIIQINLNSIIETYGASYCENQILDSASGGVFFAVAEYVIEQNGVVFGCSFTETFEVIHIFVETKEELYKLQGSKYVQSEMNRTYLQIKDFLEQGRMVLFSGTPCQVAAIKHYISSGNNNLILLDLVCHGVPSPLFFKKYISWYQGRYGEIKSYCFRSKRKRGWGLYYSIESSKGIRFGSASLDPFYRAFLDKYIYRESCYECKYAQKNRAGDITLGDLWGCDIILPNVNSIRGVSLVMINSLKGQVILDAVRDKLSLHQVNIDLASIYNENLIKPTVRPERRGWIYRDLVNVDERFFFERKLGIGMSIKKRISDALPLSVYSWVKSKKRSKNCICVRKKR